MNAVVKYHLERYLNYAKIFVEKFLNDLYADDSTSGFFSVKEACHIYLTAKQIMKEGGFELLKWNSNSVKLMNKINGKKILIAVTLKQIESYEKGFRYKLGFRN